MQEELSAAYWEGDMNRTIVRRAAITLSLAGVYLAFAYAYICGGLTLTYNLSLPNADLTPAEFHHVRYLFSLGWIPFIAFNVFLVVLYLANRFLGSPTKEAGNGQ